MSKDPRYPNGPFHYERPLTAAERRRAIAKIEQTPAKMRAAVKGLRAKQLDTPYRDGGWTVRQVVHHVPDSHLNAYTRLKLALTESEPTIKPYDEKGWANLADTRATPVETSLALLENLHRRWVTIWKSLKPSDYARTLRHPEAGVRTVDWLLALYSWHGDHHVGHVTALRKRMGW
jgi:uncharacterized damage-inducible protein DinB